MSQKKTVWFEVGETESIDDCLKRMAADRYMVVGRKEEPLFMEVDGKYIPVRQLIKFKGTLIEE